MQGQRFKTVAIYMTAFMLVLFFAAFIYMTRAHQTDGGYTKHMSNFERQIDKPANADEVFELVNKEREKAGLKPLIRMAELDVSAQYKADDMANRNYLAHEDTETGKKNGVEKGIELTGSKCYYVGENYHYGTKKMATSSSAVSGWMSSKSHHDAIVDPGYTHAGMGIAKSKDQGIISVQHFCKAN